MKKLLILVLMLVAGFSFAEGNTFIQTTIDWGIPYTYSHPNPTNDIVFNLTAGYIPLHITNDTELGFIFRESVGVAPVEIGNVDYNNLTNKAYSFENWFSVSPIIAVKFGTLVDPDINYLVAVGVAYNCGATNPQKYIGAWSSSWLLEILLKGYVIELGLMGPDFFLGAGLML